MFAVKTRPRPRKATASMRPVVAVKSRSVAGSRSGGGRRRAVFITSRFSAGAGTRTSRERVVTAGVLE
jgi:hypothetical protein